MPKVSVIIPVYNVEPYLRECLDSVINQTLRDIEIICIDDCSTDRSWDILQEYAAKDTRVVLLKNEKNTGQSVARNRGIEVAAGEYIQFVDSDDYIIEHDWFERLYQIAVQHDLDVLQSSYCYSKQVEDIIPVNESETVGQLFTGQHMLFEWARDTIGRGGVWTLFIKTQVIRENHISFFSGITSEDLLFLLELFLVAKKCMYIDLVGYAYRLRPGSTVTSSISEQRVYSFIVCAEQFIKILSRYKMDYKGCLGAVAYFCRMYETRHHHAKSIYLLSKEDKWAEDTRDAYESLFPFLDGTRFVLDQVPLIKDNSVCIYGAGVIAENLIRKLHACDISVSHVFVTDNSKGNKTLMGHNVHSIDEICFDVERDVVFVAALDQHQKAMQEKLRQKHVRNIIPFTYRF